MYDPDDFKKEIVENADLDKLLSKLQDCDLGAWDQDFVDDLAKRLEKLGDRLTVTPRQWEQLERMKGQYHVE